MHEAFVNNRTGPYIGGHNAVAFLTGQDILSQNATSLSRRISSQNVEHYLPADYLGDETLLTGYLAQRKLLKEAFTSPDAALLEIPLAGDAYILLILQKPLSRGTITLDPTNPFGPPLIDSQTLRNPLDLELMVASARLAREWTSTPSMSVLSPLENWPGRDKESDVELMDHFRGMMESGIGHQSGTAAMLPLDLGGVVDTELKVYGIEGLSVADASMIPFIPSCNLCATVYAVAEKVCSVSISLICIAVTDIGTTGFRSYKEAPFTPIQNAILNNLEMHLLLLFILYIIPYHDDSYTRLVHDLKTMTV